MSISTPWYFSYRQIEITGEIVHLGRGPRPSGLGKIDGLHRTSTDSCTLTSHLCTG